MRASGVTAIVIILATQPAAHSGGLNKQGCHAGSQPYHCHKRAQVEPLDSSNSTILNGTVTHVRDGDTIEVNDGTLLDVQTSRSGSMASKVY